MSAISWPNVGRREHFTDSDHVGGLAFVTLVDLFIDTVLVNIEKVPQEYMNSNRLMNTWCRWNMTLLVFVSKFRAWFHPTSFVWKMEVAFHDGGFDCGRVDADYTGEKMSFTVAVKEEILGQHHLSRHELSAIIKMSGSIGLSTSGLTLSVVTENAKLARHLYESFLHFYEIKSEIRHHQRSNLRKNRVYTVFTDEKVQDLLSDLHLADSFFGLETGIDEEILSDEEAGRAYICGAFLANGSIRDPESGKYQLEISSVYLDHAQGIASLLQQFLLDAKVLERKKGAVTYLQRAEDIMDFLIVIGAMQARDDFERVKILRETRNDLNRANNAETANIARTVSASMKTINNISKIKDIMGLENLPVDLQEVAQLRIQHPDYSIQQLADSLSAPLTKSGVNHRLRKINKIADEL